MGAEDESFEEGLSHALERGDASEIAGLSNRLHPADLAAFVNGLSPDDRQKILALLGREAVGPILEFLSPPDAESVLTERPEAEQRALLESLPDDDLVDFLQDVPSETKEEYLGLLSDTKKAVSSDLLKFPEHSAGGRMTTAFAAVGRDLTIRQAIDLLSEIKDDAEVLSRIFVVDEDNRLVGQVRLRDLTFNKRSTLIKELLDDEPVIAIDAMADQEEAAQMLAKYDLVALPVVDKDLKLLGLITHDDAFEILEEESTEDLEKFSAIAGGPADAAYLQTSVPAHFRRRFFWILPLALLATLSGLVIYRHEQMLDDAYVLVLYLPMVVAAGGNTGSQSATTVIRAMSLGEFSSSAFLHVVWKELRIGLLLGGLLGLCVGLFVRFFMPWIVAAPDGVPLWSISAVVGLALTGQVTTSTLLGAILPIAARASRLDPAVIASPAITTIVDVSGALIYLGLAQVLLGI